MPDAGPEAISLKNLEECGTPGYSPTVWHKKRVPGRLLSVRNSEERRRPTLPTGVSVPSARMSLTALFGMDRGGSSSL